MRKGGLPAAFSFLVDRARAVSRLSLNCPHPSMLATATTRRTAARRAAVGTTRCDASRRARSGKPRQWASSGAPAPSSAGSTCRPTAWACVSTRRLSMPARRAGTRSSASTSRAMPPAQGGHPGDVRDRGREHRERRLPPRRGGRGQHPQYDTTNAAVAGLTRALALGHAGEGIHVTPSARGRSSRGSTSAGPPRRARSSRSSRRSSGATPCSSGRGRRGKSPPASSSSPRRASYVTGTCLFLDEGETAM